MRLVTGEELQELNTVLESFKLQTVVSASNLRIITENKFRYYVGPLPNGPNPPPPL